MISSKIKIDSESKEECLPACRRSETNIIRTKYDSTDAHHCDIVSNRSSPSHFTKDSPFKNPLLGKSKRKLFEKRGNAHTAIHLRTINQFLKLVYLLTNTGKCSCCNSSQDD